MKLIKYDYTDSPWGYIPDSGLMKFGFWVSFWVLAPAAWFLGIFGFFLEGPIIYWALGIFAVSGVIFLWINLSERKKVIKKLKDQEKPGQENPEKE